MVGPSSNLQVSLVRPRKQACPYASPLVILVTESDVVSFIGVFLSILIELSES